MGIFYVILFFAHFSAWVNGGFFQNILGGNNEVVQNTKSSVIRGLPDGIAKSYNLLDDNILSMQCDQNKVIPFSSLNDGYCDCMDGTDEPGTSACTNSIFYCVNAGYKLIKIPSSRVDDGICDCCDGSDEGNIKACSNTCR